MGKSIKITNDTYLDSESIIHNYPKNAGFGKQRTLSEILQDRKNQTINTPGWYQLARFESHDNNFEYGASVILSVFQSYYYFSPEVHTLLVEVTYRAASVKQLNYPPARINSVISKYRIVRYDENTDIYYLEGYFEKGNNQGIYVERISNYTPVCQILIPIQTTTTPAVIHKEISSQTDPILVPMQNSISNLQTYSTSETVIGTYKGKTLYRKILDLGTVTFNGGTMYFAHGISGPDRIVHLEYSMYYPSNGRWYKNWDCIDTLNTVVDNTNIIMAVDPAVNSTTFYYVDFVIDYTKD